MCKTVAILLFIMPAVVFAQREGFTEIHDRVSFKQKFYEESGKIKSISSDFVQEKELTVLSEKIISGGKFWFKREDKIRIEYQTPFFYLMIINGNELTIRDDQNETTLNVRSNKLFQQVNNIMVESVNGTIIENDDFSVRVFEDPEQYLMQMIPVEKKLKGFFDSIHIIANKKSFSVTVIEMNETSGDRTIIKFNQQKLNTVLSDEIFTRN